MTRSTAELTNALASPPPSRLRRVAGHVRARGWTIVTLAVALLVSVPVLVVAGHVFVPAGDVWNHLASTTLPRYVENSLLLMLGVGTGTLLIGVAGAWFVTMCRFPGRRVFEWALLLPLALPTYVIAYTYTGLLDYAGPVQGALRAVFGWQAASQYWFPEIRSLWGAAAMMVLVLYPYVYLLARAAFLQQSVCVLEISRTLGHGPWSTFWTCALPLARPAIAAGTALALMEALSDFGTVQFFAVDTFTTGIFRTWFGLGEPAAAAQLSAVLLGFIALLLAVERIGRHKARYHHTSNRYRALPRIPLTGARAWAATAICGLPILLGFLLPAGALLAWAASTAGEMVDARFWEYAANSFSLAAVTAVLAVGIAVLLAYGARMAPSRPVVASTRLASMGYAVPGAVIAVGVLVPFAAIDNAVDGWMRATFGFSTGLVLTGTVAALVFAYMVRYLAVAFGAVESSLGKVTRNMDGAARTLGSTSRGTLVRVHVPLIRSGLLAAGALVFVDVMKELPATLILRPFNFNTLATHVYSLAGDERLADSSSAALAIVLVGIVPVVLLSRALAHSRPGQSQEVE